MKKIAVIGGDVNNGVAGRVKIVREAAQFAVEVDLNHPIPHR